MFYGADSVVVRRLGARRLPSHAGEPRTGAAATCGERCWCCRNVSFWLRRVSALVA